MQRAAKHNRKNIYLKMSETCIWKMTDIWMWTRIAERERERIEMLVKICFWNISALTIVNFEKKSDSLKLLCPFYLSATFLQTLELNLVKTSKKCLEATLIK